MAMVLRQSYFWDLSPANISSNVENSIRQHAKMDVGFDWLAEEGASSELKYF
jgi:hypothetical protein